jgi:single-stranded-DNA-specific exonuclease
LKAVAGLERTLTSFDIGFRLGPRLNAAGRLDTAQDSLDLLLTDDPLEAHRIAMRLEERNRERQKVEMRIHAEAGRMIEEEFRFAQDPAIVVGSRSWHPGVIGIVASRIVRRHHRPTFVIAIDDEGIGKGSGRSVEGVSLVDAIDACRDLLLKGGGHEMAAGVTIEEEKLPAFRERFASYVSSTASADTLRPRLYLDAEARFEDLTLDLLDSYELLHPFGNENEQPVFLSRGVQLIEEPRLLKGNHLKLQLAQEGVVREAIYFGGGEIDLPRPPWDVAFTIDRNVYRGRASLNISIKAVRTSEEE